MSKLVKKPVGTNKDEKDVKKKNSSASRSKGKTPRQIMHAHVHDKDNVITDEEFKNLNIGVDVTDEDVQELSIENNTKRPKDEDKDPNRVTPWDVINE